jgi:general secretion pathway protein F
MPLFHTPGHYVSRAMLYQQLGQLTAAGLTLQSAVEIQLKSPPARSLREPLKRVLSELKNGGSFADAVQAASSWVPPFDIALLHAGEQSGRLPVCFALLAQHYETSATLLRQVLSGLMYPALLLHFAILLAPLPQLVLTGDVAVYFWAISLVLVPLYALFFGVLWLLHGQERSPLAAGVEKVLHRVPILGRARRNLAVARLASALEALISAGVPIFRAWDLAAAACGSPALRNAVRRWPPLLENGVTPSETLRMSPEFPEVFTNLYHTGEISGTLDDTLRRLQTLYQSEGARQMKALAEWTPKLIYFGIVFFVAYQVVRFWAGHFSALGQL